MQHEARTFIFPDVLERERQSSVFPLDNPYFAEGPSADDAEQAEVVEVHCSVAQLADKVGLDCGSWDETVWQGKASTRRRMREEDTHLGR